MRTIKKKERLNLRGHIDLIARKVRVQYNDSTYELPLLVFQRALGVHEQDIPCIITKYSDNKIYIKQNIGLLLQNYYNIGDRVLFKVKEDFSYSERGYYEVIDEYGFVGYLSKNDLPKSRRLYKGEGIYCRIIRFAEDFPILLPIAFSSTVDKSPFGAEQVYEILGQTRWDIAPFIQILLATDSNVSNESFSHEWIIKLLTEGFDLDLVRTDICNLLELSPLLNQCEDEERKRFQNRLTQIIDYLHHYTEAHHLLTSSMIEEEQTESQARDFVNSIIEKIKRSGFVYHPETNLGIMMAIFRLDSSLMLEVMPSLIESVCLRGDACKREPFRSTLIQLLELYIQHVDQRLSLDSGQESLVLTIIQALAVQLLLATEEDTHLVSYNINQSKLYRYVSRSSKTKVRHTIDLAYTSLIGQGNMPTYTFERILDVDNLIGLFCNHELGKDNKNKATLERELSYETDTTKLSIDDQQIEISRVDGQQLEYNNALPEGLNLWNDLSIYVPEGKRIAFKASGAIKESNIDITPLQEMWRNIERELFAPKTIITREQTKIAPDIDQEVTIYIESQDEDIAEKFYCRIEDSRYEGAGFIKREDIVIYRFPDKAPIDLACFRDSDARPYLLKAKVLDIYNDGSMKFGMKDTIDSLVNRASQEYESMVAQLIYFDTNNKIWVGVSSEGYPIVVSDPQAELKWLGLIEMDNLTYMPNFRNIEGHFLEIIPEDDEEFPNRTTFIYDAFVLLMEELSEGRVLELQECSEKSDMEPGALLSTEQVKELMYCLDRIAHIEEDYVSSFNYLGVAKIVAEMLQMESNIRYYEGLRRLILLLHDFNINDRVDVATLDEIRSANEELFRSNALLLHQFKLLKIVSLLGQEDAYQELWQYRQNDSSDQILKELSDLVLAHNMLSQYGLPTQAADVHNHIKRNLRLKERRSDYKDYGSETQEIEFKTSIVYPPNNGMQPDIQAQTTQIVSVVASMMNTNGGKIYIGVNDSGLGIGIEHDLRFDGFNYNKDKYLRHIQYQISTQLGAVPGGLVNIIFDEDNKLRDICIIEVRPYPNGVCHLDYWPVRQGTMRQYMTKQEFELYNAIRLRSLDRDEQTTDNSPSPITQVATTKTNSSKKVRLEIKTSLTRPFASTSGITELHLNILENGQFICSEYPRGGAVLSLEMYREDEVLVVVYEDGSVVNIPKEKFVEKERERGYSFFSDKIPAFCSFARKEDILTILYASRGTTYIHPILVSDLTEGDLSSVGSIPTSHPVDYIVCCELAIAALGIDLHNYIKRSQGIPLAHNSGKHILRSFSDIGFTLIE